MSKKRFTLKDLPYNDWEVTTDGYLKEVNGNFVVHGSSWREWAFVKKDQKPYYRRNMKLMIAAPQLMKSLEVVLSDYCALCDFKGVEQSEEVQAACVAIAKARGLKRYKPKFKPVYPRQSRKKLESPSKWADAPNWAKWFAVDRRGHGYWFEVRPKKEKGGWLPWVGFRLQLVGKFDATDWQDSLEKRAPYEPHL